MPIKTQTTTTAGFVASMAGFLRAELKLAATLIRLAGNADDSEKKRRGLSNARIACNAIETFLPRTPLSDSEKQEIRNALARLKSDLRSEAKIPTPLPQEAPPRWSLLDALTASHADSALETSMERFMADCAFAQRRAWAMVLRNREIMARSERKLF